MGLVTSILARANSDHVLHKRGEAVAEEELAESAPKLDTAHNSCLMHTDMFDNNPKTVPGSWDGTYELDLEFFYAEENTRVGLVEMRQVRDS